MPMAVLTTIFSTSVPLLVGSLASAEERHFGTLDWQVLLPIATWKQWAVKSGMALGLSLALAIGVPVLLTAIHPSGDDLRISAFDAVSVVALTISGIYVSSLCTSGLRALLASLVVAPAVLGVGLFYRVSVANPGGLRPSILPGRAASALTVRDEGSITVLPLVLVAAFLWLVLSFALENHRSAEPGAKRVGQQATMMASCLAIGAAILSVFW